MKPTTSISINCFSDILTRTHKFQCRVTVSLPIQPVRAKKIIFITQRRNLYFSAMKVLALWTVFSQSNLNKGQTRVNPSNTTSASYIERVSFWQILECGFFLMMYYSAVIRSVLQFCFDGRVFIRRDSFIKKGTGKIIDPCLIKVRFTFFKRFSNWMTQRHSRQRSRNCEGKLRYALMIWTKPRISDSLTFIIKEQLTTQHPPTLSWWSP